MEYQYQGINGCASKCGLEIHRHPDFTLVICTELQDNPGTSVTNWAEKLAYEVCQENQIDPGKLVWVEHYPPSKWTKSADTYDVVDFWAADQKQYADATGSLGHPAWRRITIDQLNQLIAGVWVE